MATHYGIVHLSEVGSTQDEASHRFSELGEPTLVLADRQVAGRGRQGRTWEQPDRAMFSSLAFEIDWDVEHRTLVPLIAGLVVCEAISAHGGRSAALKWPNDVVIGPEKTGGILVELEGDVMTVGCGVNLWWAEPIVGATSAFLSDPGDEAASSIAQEWASALLEEVAKGGRAWRKVDYLSLSATVGNAVEWEGGRGTAIGVTDAGALVVETSDGVKTIHAGDVHMRGRR